VIALAGATWREIRDRPLVLVPLGSTEQHGPHLPMETDTVIAESVTARTAALLPSDVVVAPALAYGASGEHQMFAGTSSIGSRALRELLVELVRSMTTWSGGIVLINAHGGNSRAVEGAVLQLVEEGRDVCWVPCAAAKGDAHAGRTETSLMMHLRPSSVRLGLAQPGNTTPIGRLIPALVRNGVAAASPNGVLGDPTGATADEGARCFEHMAQRIASLILDGARSANGMLIPASKAVR